MRHRISFAFVGFLAMAGFCLVGCNDSQSSAGSGGTSQSQTDGDGHDHDHGHDHGDGHDHDHAHDADLTFDESIHRIQALSKQIGDSMEKGDTETPHEALHEIGRLLDQLPKKAEDSKLSEDLMKNVTEASNSLMDAYGEIDAKLHGVEGKTYDEVKDKINTALQQLESAHSHD